MQPLYPLEMKAIVDILQVRVLIPYGLGTYSMWM